MKLVARRHSLHVPGSSVAWPGASNTGVPAGTTLTPSAGNFDTSSNNQIVQDLDIAGALVINHANVTVRRCRIVMPLSEIAVVFIAGPASGTLLIEDCELDGSNKGGSSGIFWDNSSGIAVTVRRLNLSRVENGIGCLSNFDMRDCWVHGLDPGGADPHTDGLQTSAGVSNVAIVHNTFDMAGAGDGPNNSCIQLNTTTTDNFNWLVENNKLLLNPVTGGACVRLPNGNATGNNIRVRNNRMLPGVFGYSIPDPPNTITEWSGNVHDTTGVPV